MTSASYTGRLRVGASAEDVFDAVATLDGLRGWWTPLVSGAPTAGGEVRFDFAGLDEHILMAVEEVRRPVLVRWRCVTHTSLAEWAGTQLVFEIDAIGPAACTLDFRHEGLTRELDCYYACAAGWDHFLASLTSYVERGRGTPFRRRSGEPAARGSSPMSDETALEVAQAYHAAWTGGDFDAARRRLADDLETDVPINTYATREEFLQAVKGFGSRATNVRLLAEFGNRDEALLLYDMDVDPIGPFRVAEHFTVSGGRIERIRHVHDTAPLRAGAS